MAQRRLEQLVSEALLSNIERRLFRKQDSKPKGLALIITNSYSGQPKFTASHKDGEKMRELFEDTFKFACYWKKDLNASRIKDLIQQVATCDYTTEYGKHIQYIVFVFSGDGEYGTIIGNDLEGRVRIQEDIIDALKPHNMPKTSPDKEIIKLFFIDANRAGGKMIAQESQIVHPPGKYLVAFSTSSGCPAYTPEGSLWMSAVAKHLKDETEETIYNAIEHANKAVRSCHNNQLPITYAIGGCGTNKLHVDLLPCKPPKLNIC